MPSVAQEEVKIPSAKKRRRDDEHDADIHLQCSAQNLHASQNLFAQLRNNNLTKYDGEQPTALAATSALINRKIYPLAKRPRVEDERRELSDHGGMDYRNQNSDRARPASPASRHSRGPEPPSTDALQQTSANSRPQPSRTTIHSTASLKPCHICHRRPTKKSDLDSFADCQGCGQRSCFVCIRQCLGWHPGSGSQGQGGSLGDIPYATSCTMEEDSRSENVEEEAKQQNSDAAWARGGRGHRQMVCSRCCVERGADGDVVCLGCLPFVDG